MGLGAGFAGATFAVVGFGSNYVVVKKYDMGDGMLFQLIMAVGIWIFSVVVQLYRTTVDNKMPYFHQFAMIGGILWSVGNVLTVPIIKLIGMALGLAIWSATTMIIGWATGRWSLLGTPKDTSVKTKWLNYVGILMTLSAMLIFFNVKPDSNNPKPAKNYSLNRVSESPGDDKQGESLLPNQPTWIANISNQQTSQTLNQSTWIDDLPKQQKQILGIGLALIAGCCYGLMFCPIQYLMNHHSNNNDYSQELIDYDLTFCSGILCGALTFFSIYCIYTKNDPFVNVYGIFPGIICGIIWSIAQTGWLIANSKDNLGTQTSFVIVGGTPQVIASLWGVLLYKEITGKRNLFFLLCAIFVALCGVACVALSKISL